jgi:hypothetical protein
LGPGQRAVANSNFSSKSPDPWAEAERIMALLAKLAYGMQGMGQDSAAVEKNHA